MTVFISYAKEDVEHARKLYADLKGTGFDVWLDEEILRPGQNWRIAINDAIRKSRFFIALLSKHSVNKRGFVQKELRIALDVLAEYPRSEVFIIPARLDDCSVSDDNLKDLHYVDLFPDYQKGFDKILLSLGAMERKVNQISIPPVVSPESVAYSPIIEEVLLDRTTIKGGGQIQVTLRAKSNAPIRWLDRGLEGPRGNVYGGGSRTRFEQLANEIWETTWVEKISRWAPSGVYTYTRISVRNEAELSSTPWPSIQFMVENSEAANCPILQTVELDKKEIPAGGEVKITIRGLSNAPIRLLNKMLIGPRGIVYGGGSATNFRQVGLEIWEHQWTEEISKWAPPGSYTLTKVSIENEGQLVSEEWPDVTFTVTGSNG